MKKDKKEVKEKSNISKPTKENREVLFMPALPLRNLVVFPSVVIDVFGGRTATIEAVKHLDIFDNKILLVAQRNGKDDTISNEKQTYDIGVVSTVIRTERLEKEVLKLTVVGDYLVKINKILPVVIKEEKFEKTKISNKNHFLLAEIEKREIIHDIDRDSEFARRKFLLDRFVALNDLVNFVPEKVMKDLLKNEDLTNLIDTLGFTWSFSTEAKQKLLSEFSLEERYKLLLSMIEKEIYNFHIMQQVGKNTKKQIEKTQHKYFLMEQMKSIQKELGEEGEDSDELLERINKAKLPKEVEKKIRADHKKIKMMPPMSSEGSVLRAYIELVLDLPWNSSDKVRYDIKKAKEILDKDHYGLEKIKDTILEFIAVLNRTKQVNSKILCLVGPPGVGKTSIGESIARAMGRNFQRIALGGLHDEAELRGHRKTYVGAMPGKIIQKLKQAKVNNGVVLLDEIDKLGKDFRGDPASAFLEILDPEQNKHFVDNYLELEFDLSNILFICTANYRDNIPEALRDRMEILQIAGYVDSEKMKIAKNYLIPRQFKAVGLKEGELSGLEHHIAYLIHHYTRESGVRNLERVISKICRKAVKEIDETGAKLVSIDKEKIIKYLGVEPYNKEDKELSISEEMVGEVNGLAWTAYGGDILKIQATVLPNGKGDIKTTGSLGNVMKESVSIAMTVVQKQLAILGGDKDIFKQYDFHIHFPDGATPKDGPSAGIAITSALLSAILQIKVNAKMAMTGEINITGRVLPIGGLKEKLYAASYYGIKRVIIPKANATDLEEVPAEIKDKLEIIQVKHVYEVWENLFKDKLHFTQKQRKAMIGTEKSYYLTYTSGLSK